MSTTIHQQLCDVHERFGENHDRLRADFVQRLAQSHPAWQDQPAVTLAGRGGRQPVLLSGRFWKPVLAMAACVAIVIGAAWYLHTPEVAPQPKMAWANALDQVRDVDRMHLKVMTYSKGKESQMEVWWRRSGDIRMEFANGLIMTNNAAAWKVFNPKADVIKMTIPNETLDDMALGVFGQLFTSPEAVSVGRFSDGHLVFEEPLMYRGEQCRKLTFEGDDFRSEFIIEPEVGLIYEASAYDKSQPPQPIYRMVVLDMNQMDASLFDITPGDNTRVVDLRSPAMREKLDAAVSH